MKRDNTIEAFFALVKAGLWEKDVNLSEFGEIDYDKLLQLAEEQSVTGLVAAGFDHVKQGNPPKEIVLQFVGQTLQIEQQNTAMNKIIGDLINKLREADIYTLLVKGQGIAQCYVKPLWRSCGDVDLFLSDDNYEKARNILLPLGELTEPEEAAKKHLSLRIGEWIVELHGTLRSGLSRRIDKMLDTIKDDVFYGGNVRSWNNGNTQVFIPSAICDAIYVFSHILQHFFKGGIGIRQICDWCRLLWTYSESLDHGLLESRIKKMGLMSEWRAFGAFAVECLDMPVEAMPLLDVRSQRSEGRYEIDKRLRRKAERIKDFILMSGNFGYNRDSSYMMKYPYLTRKGISAWIRVKDLSRHSRVFPLDSIRFLWYIMLNGFKSALKGE